MFFLQNSTGSALISDWVKAPATVVPFSKTAVKISLLPLYFVPDFAVLIETPLTKGNLGKFLGAKGDIFLIISFLLN